MKCYLCKREVGCAIRTYVSARDNREKSKFRDLCEGCNVAYMGDKGMVLHGRVWEKGDAEYLEARKQMLEGYSEVSLRLAWLKVVDNRIICTANF